MLIFIPVTMATTQFKVTILALFGFISYFIPLANAAVGPLVLQMYPSVAANQPATYYCTSNTATSGDPTFIWSVREHGNHNNVIQNNIPQTGYNDHSDPTDGHATSTLTFTMLSNYINQDIYCGAVEFGSSSFASSIYGQILPGTTPTGGLGQNCNSDGSCSVTGAVCSNNACVCGSGYYQSGTSCVQEAEIGQSCVNSASCRPANSFCNSGLLCQCNAGYVLSNQECVLDQAQLDESCAAGETCVTSFSECSTSFPIVCVCHSNYYRLVIGSTPTCQPKGGLGGSCTNGRPDSCLTTNAECVGSTCVCASGYIQSGSSCIFDSSAGLGESCNGNTVTCSVPNSVCTGSPLTCQCVSGYYQVGNTCNPSGGIGDPCSTSNSASCSTGNSECSPTTSQCACINGYVYVSATQTCDQPSLGQACAVSVGCKATATTGSMTNPLCSSGVCACPSNYYALNGQCLQSGGIGSGCSTTNAASCFPDHSECSTATSTCVCAPGYVHIAGTQTCDQPSLGQSCVVSVGCKAGTTYTPVCSGGVCACPTNYYVFNSQCFQKGGLGQSCNTAVANSCSDPNAQCSSSTVTCQCNQGYFITTGVCVFNTSGQTCPASSGQLTTGVSSPPSLSTPNVLVNSTCYRVDLFQSETMFCDDIKDTSALQYGGWQRLVGGSWTDVVQETGSFINGDAATPALTVSNALTSYAGQYRCVLCYGSQRTRCTTSDEVTLHVTGSVISSVSTTMFPGSPQRGNTVTLTCTTSPPGVANSYRWLRNGVLVSTQSVYTINDVQPTSDGTYICEATNNFGTVSSSGSPITMSVKFAPQYSIAGGGDSQDVFGNLASSPITIDCVVTANPDVQTYYFYDIDNQVLQSSSSNTFEIDNDQGYGTYSCIAENEVGSSLRQYFVVQQRGGASAGAATEDSGLSTGVIAAIVLGIIFLLLLIIIIIVCCCSYGWCRKKEKVQPEIVPTTPRVIPYVERTVTSAKSGVSRRDVGILVKGHDFPDDQERWPYKTGYYYRMPTYKKQFIPDDKPHYAIPIIFPAGRKSHIDSWDDALYAKPMTYITPLSTGEFRMSAERVSPIPETGHYSRKPPMITQGEPESYTTPRYHLKPATKGGPIISMYDDTYSQPRPLQLPALDTQYLYVDDNEGRKKRKKRKKHRHESPRRSYYEPDPDQEEVDTKYAEVLDSRSDDLVVVPGKSQNYFE